jgi:hypothetical protein
MSSQFFPQSEWQKFATRGDVKTCHFSAMPTFLLFSQKLRKMLDKAKIDRTLFLKL